MTACFLLSGLFWNISEEIFWEVGISREIWGMNALWEIAFWGIYFLGILFPREYPTAEGNPVPKTAPAGREPPRCAVVGCTWRCVRRGRVRLL